MKVFLTLIFALCGLVPVLNVLGQCATDEYGPACDCNTTLYTSQAKPPIPVIDCSGGNMKISVSKCQLEKSNFNTSNLHLIDPTCTGKRAIVNGLSNTVVTNPLRNGVCGNSIRTNGSHVTYSNTLYINPKINPIIAANYFNASVSCSYPLNATVVLNSTLNPVLGVTEIAVPGGNGNVTVNMAAYEFAEFVQPLSEQSVVKVEDTIYISVNAPELDAGSFSVQVTRIFATSPLSPGIQYDLLTGGCPAAGVGEGLLSVIRNGNGTESRFAMKVFQITGSATVDLFAVLTLCNNRCVQTCPISTGRSGESTGDTATVSVGLTAEDKADYSSGTFNRFSLPFTMSSLLLSILFVKLM
uniref:ZP domain-containing protein n=1 Tax=Leptobrachium leishanense TaxID=445787 RepID=A0A8C5P7A1_9ANUR